MKKFLAVVLVAVLLIGGGGFAWYKMAYGGNHYYVKITDDGQKLEEKSDSGEKFIRYDYFLKASNKEGEVKNIEFKADHNLRKTAYLDVTLNSHKGVTSWEEVKESELPKKAKAVLN